MATKERQIGEVWKGHTGYKVQGLTQIVSCDTKKKADEIGASFSKFRKQHSEVLENIGVPFAPVQNEELSSDKVSQPSTAERLKGLTSWIEERFGRIPRPRKEEAVVSKGPFQVSSKLKYRVG